LARLALSFKNDKIEKDGRKKISIRNEKWQLGEDFQKRLVWLLVRFYHAKEFYRSLYHLLNCSSAGPVAAGFLFLVLAVFLGFTLEMVNTTMEKVVDLITEKYHPTAKIVKDLSAGVMLIVSVGVAVIGFLVIFPPLWRRFF